MSLRSVQTADRLTTPCLYKQYPLCVCVCVQVSVLPVAHLADIPGCSWLLFCATHDKLDLTTV